MASKNNQSALSKAVHQSPPTDLKIPYASSWVKGKTILITGGASGFGAGFFRKWAENGANVIIGDINVKGGNELVREVREATGNENLHFIHCDVTDWQSQVNFFQAAAKLSPHGGIDTVVANAGIAAPSMEFELPKALDATEPAKPDLKVVDVDLTGVLYTTHLALFWLGRNPKSQPANPSSDPATSVRDRHLLLLGSVASLAPLPGQVLYGVSKHGVLGLFRCLRASSFVHGVRVNMLCPYFIDTPIVPTVGRLALAGDPMGTVEDVVEAGTRFAADTRILGRALVVGPKLRVEQQENGEWTLVPKGSNRGEEASCYEAYADDWEEGVLLLRRMTSILNAAVVMRGWGGWFADIFRAIIYGLTRLFGR